LQAWAGGATLIRVKAKVAADKVEITVFMGLLPHLNRRWIFFVFNPELNIH
jgi:hypothetical protein